LLSKCHKDLRLLVGIKTLSTSAFALLWMQIWIGSSRRRFQTPNTTVVQILSFVFRFCLDVVFTGLQADILPGENAIGSVCAFAL
jgi:hypothetical protein